MDGVRKVPEQLPTASIVPPACPTAGEDIELTCPRCGLKGPGVRCLRCDAVKLLPCSGDCGACRKACG
jgi:hypothetical protein